MQIDYSISQNGELIIYDITGMKLYSYSLKPGDIHFFINNNFLENGIYIYRVTSGDEILTTEKLIIIK